MSFRRFHFLAVVISLGLSLSAPAARAVDDSLRFNRDIRPILSDRCFKCHGPDASSRKAKLRLDDPDNAFGPRKDPNEHAIVPGKPDQSVLVRRIFATDPDDLMPPPASNLKLSDAEKETLREWIAQGAKYERHWAFVPPPKSVPVPETRDQQWPRNEIDRFVLARLEKEGLRPSPEAAKTRWLRRVTFDLTGLPPTPAEIDAFLADNTPAAYEKVVDRLLASPHFGERLAVPWLDAARYADSYGYQSDQLCPTWPYRDWVVDAFNQNMPYNEFITEQLAGDLLSHPTRRQRLATAFNRLHRQTNEGGSDAEEWRNEYVSDRVRTFSSVFLGLTFECARCHDHKFDPITQRDYYSLSAFFNSIDEFGLYNDSQHVPTPSLLLPTPEQDEAMRRTSNDRKIRAAQLRETVAEVEPAFQSWLRRNKLEATNVGLAARFTFDRLVDTNRIPNEVAPKTKSDPLSGNTLAPGKFGQAVKFTGDDILQFTNLPTGLDAWNQFSVSCWLRLPATLTNGAIIHQSEGTDVGFHGTELVLQDGRLFFAIKRFWPGNAIAVQSVETLPRDQWIQIGVTYDGSGEASGMKLFLNGRSAPTTTVRDHLYKSPECGEQILKIGARFRSYGLKDALMDELQIYSRPLAPIEFAQLYDGHSLTDALANAKSNADALREYYLSAISQPVALARAEQSEAVKHFFQARNHVQETSVMEETAAPRATFVLARGRFDAPKNAGTRVTRATPSFLPPFAPGLPRNRLGLAGWLTAPDHPLTARVAVNRFWQMLFGRGIVATPENFGAQGSPPSHPELLDWLARDFINAGWNTKALLKKIVLSATYRQDSATSKELRERDPDNDLLARGPSQRLSAEMIRDTALVASGLLDDKSGGPPVSPYLPSDLWRESNDMSPAYHQSVGADLYRRSVYTVWKRTAPMPDMLAFDAPSREVCLMKRLPTGTPQQAFVLLNETQFVEAARVLAQEMLEQQRPESQEIAFAFQRLAGRQPDDTETKILEDLWREQSDFYAQSPTNATQLIAIGDRKPDPKLKPADLAAATEVAQAILNLDATIWKR